MRKLIVLGLLAGLALAALFALPAGAKSPGANGRIVFARFDPAARDTFTYTVNPNGSHVQQLFSAHPSNTPQLNLDAEVLTKMLGASVYRPSGSIAKGARAIQSWARRHGVSDIAHDGSGLSYANRISTNAIVQLLSRANREAWGPALRSTLPTAGEGTLAGRLSELRIRAKTGTLLLEVSALSGWVWSERSHRWAEFSILSQGLMKPQAVALEDRTALIIASQV